MIREFKAGFKVSGELRLPGDKSISHRAVIFSSMAKGRSEIYNCADSADLKSSMNCFRSLGNTIDQKSNQIIIEGRGYNGFKKPVKPLDAGNSGTTARLISGVLVAQKFSTQIIGDESLSKRPMERIIEPLSRMGADLLPSPEGTLPLTINPSKKFHAIEYQLPVASAQVKSAILLAGLHLSEITNVIEPVATRNHTENMLNLPVVMSGESRVISSSIDYYPQPGKFYIPSDISTASFFIVLTLCSKNSQLILRDVLLNPTRAGILEILIEMGGDIKILEEKKLSGEVYGDLQIRSSELKNINIQKGIIPNIIDEIPILTIAGLFAEGHFSISNAGELRKKESDRISAVCSNLRILNLDVSETEEGFTVGGHIQDKKPLFESFGDHRIAMAFGTLSLLLNKGGSVNNFQAVGVSNPNFMNQLGQILK